MKQTKVQRQRTKRVFRWLEKHADRFNMANFIGEGHLEELAFSDPKLCKAEFEQCGTTACVAGAAVLLYPGLTWSRSFVLSGERILGVNSSAFFTVDWWNENKADYYKARERSDYAGMVAAAKKQFIDWGYLDA